VSVESDAPLMKNAIAFVHTGDASLKGEVLRVQGHRADLQIFEETQGVRVGDGVELTPQMLSATLGPGLLGMIYDGLQNPLQALAERDGFFLVRGKAVAPLDLSRTWTFVPSRKPGERCRWLRVFCTKLGRTVRPGECPGCDDFPLIKERLR